MKRKSDEKCKTCRFGFRTCFGAGVGGEYMYACGYADVMRRRRPCPAGKKCTAYEKGSNRRDPWTVDAYYGIDSEKDFKEV